MKKILLIIFNLLLFGDTFNYYFFSLKENYKEYSLGKIIDKDYNSYGDMLGLGIKYNKNLGYLNFYLLTEATYGESIYDGAYQNGVAFKARQKNVGIYNLKAGLSDNFYILELGYRFWNRGNTDSIGDYNEQYYWAYIGFGFENYLKFNSFEINYYLKYNYALSPKLKIYLWNNPTINLGDTRGYEAEISLKKRVNYDFSLGVFYKFVYWHINRSNIYNIVYNGTIYQIYEPESETKNQYLGIFIQKSF